MTVRRRREERGSVSVELVLVTPLLLLLLLFVVALGRLASARIEVDGVAAQAARAASIARDPEGAATAAEQTATTALADDHASCPDMQVVTDTSDFTAGGAVAVTITCNVHLSDLAGLRLPATTAISAKSISVIDTYRATTS